MKRSYFGYITNHGWAEIADELDLRHKREVKDDSQDFWPKQLGSMESLLAELGKTVK